MMNSNSLFMAAVVLVSLMLFGLIIGTACYKLTYGPVAVGGNQSSYLGSTTFWVYASISWAIALIMLLILLYMAYWYATMTCGVPACPKPRRKTVECAY